MDPVFTMFIEKALKFDFLKRVYCPVLSHSFRSGKTQNGSSLCLLFLFWVLSPEEKRQYLNKENVFSVDLFEQA